MSMRTLLLICLIGVSSVPETLAAQFVAPSRGWIGISAELMTANTANGVRMLVEVTDVYAEGPARAAGVRPGDVLLSVNEIAGPDSLSNLGEYLHLSPGDPVRIVLSRAGRRQVLDLHAGERSERSFVGTRLTLRFEPDSMVETMVRAMDSLRARLVETGGVYVVNQSGRTRGSVTLIGPPGAAPRLVEMSARDEPRPPRWAFPDTQDFARGWMAREVQAPFLFELFRTDKHDSLSLEMEVLNHTIRDLQLRHRDRRLELVHEVETRASVPATDAELGNLEVKLEDLSLRAMRLRKSMEEAARSSAENVWVTSAAPAVPADGVTREFRPLTPYLLGQNRAAGAEVIDLTPQLAVYFKVDGGVLVVDVPGGTPAAIAGILAGDVIIKIDQLSIRSVEDLRLGLSRSTAVTPITLIREGTSRQVLLRR